MDLYAFLKDRCVKCNTIEELHTVQKIIRRFHPEATQEYISDHYWEDYPYIGVAEEDVNELFFVGYSHSARFLEIMSLGEFLAIIEAEQEPDIQIDVLSIL